MSGLEPPLATAGGDLGDGGYLLLRRGGALWGVANREVERLARRPDGYRLQVAGHALAADEILGVVGALDVRPLALVVRRFWPEAAGGWAIAGRLPIVVVDPRRPPRALEVALEPALEPDGGELPHGD
jgi:hypothetical protein